MTTTTTLPPKRSRWKSWLLALLIFIGGGAFGSGLTAFAIVHRIQHAIQHPEEVPARITARLARRLDLSKEQARQVQQIIAARQQALTDIRRDVQPRIEVQLTQLESDIDKVLNPAQQAKWHALLTTLRQNWLPPVSTTAPSPD